MDHLEPKDDDLLPTAEVIRRLQKEFRIVEIDKEGAADELRVLLDWLRKLQAKGKEPGGEPIAHTIERHEAMLDQTYALTIADKEEADLEVLSTLLKPDERLSFGYSSDAHEKAARPLLERAAKVLGYEIISE